MDVILYDFHDFFDGLLGLRDIIDLEFIIDPVNQVLRNNEISIPFYYREKNNETHSLIVMKYF